MGFFAVFRVNLDRKIRPEIIKKTSAWAGLGSALVRLARHWEKIEKSIKNGQKMMFMIVSKSKVGRHGQINLINVPVIGSALVSTILSIFTTTATVK
jgi:hypothetical protein